MKLHIEPTQEQPTWTRFSRGPDTFEVCLSISPDLHSIIEEPLSYLFMLAETVKASRGYIYQGHCHSRETKLGCLLFF